MRHAICTQVQAELLGGFHRVEAGQFIASDLKLRRQGAAEESLHLNRKSTPYEPNNGPPFLKNIPVSLHYFGNETDYSAHARKVAVVDNELHGTSLKPTFVDLVQLVQRER